MPHCAPKVLITSFSADAVINTGIAGSLDPSIDIGDVVLSTDSVNHIMDVQNLGYEPGQTPGIEVVAYPASETLRNTAKNRSAKARSKRPTKAALHQVTDSCAKESEKGTDQSSVSSKLLRKWRVQQLLKTMLPEQNTLFNSTCNL